VIDAGALLGDCKALVRNLAEDLRTLTGSGPETTRVVDAEYAGAKAARRTALTKAEWAEGFYAQVAVAWVLGCVFVRFCEDNGLVPDPLLSGPGGRRAIALDHRTAYVHAHPAHDDRHWLREIFRRYKALPATGEIFGDHNPVWLLAPSADGARSLVQAFQAVDPEKGEVRHDFFDPSCDTRFLGDLYQDLSEHAKKTYALLQTPVFVEEFILDRTLEPALATFGLRETTLIDPTCGSGHFLLGAFARLFKRWMDAEPATNPRELVRRGLDAIAGVDLNPFAAAITRFRLLVAALVAGGDRRLAGAPAYPINVAVGDSLLLGDPPERLPGTSVDDERAGAVAHGYSTEDVEKARRLLSQGWHVVVGNPPYINVVDAALNALYRSRFQSCYRQYSLTVPFLELFFQLALQSSSSDQEQAGFVGVICANSFAKREFGRRLVEQWVPTVDITHLLDTSGASIPGHGIETIILFGRSRHPVAGTIRMALGRRGEPREPQDPSEGLVWRSIISLIDRRNVQNEWVSVVDVERHRMSSHPWTLSGGGAADLREVLSVRGKPLSLIAKSIGLVAVTREDDVFQIGQGALRRAQIPTDLRRPLIEGERIRDWDLLDHDDAFFPYTSDELTAAEARAGTLLLWPWRTQLKKRTAYGKTQLERGLKWWEYSMLFRDRLSEPKIVSPTVASLNHFWLEQSERVFKDSVLAIQLSATMSRDEQLQLLAVLNSSLAEFWFKQVMQRKSNDKGRGSGEEERDPRYSRDATKLGKFPVDGDCNLAIFAVEMRRVVAIRQLCRPSRVVQNIQDLAGRLDTAGSEFSALAPRLIAIQEELDWSVYAAYGLTSGEVVGGAVSTPPLQLGERAFEIVLARRMAAGEAESSWFVRHGSMPITDLPASWPPAYKELVERRIELIETDRNIGLIEGPEHKRRWLAKPWERQVEEVLRRWLLDRLESPRYWSEPAALTSTTRLAAEARTDPDFVQVAQLYAGQEDVDIAALVAELAKAEAVPYLAALRYTDSGMRKHKQWLETWDLQRREDAGEDVGTIPVPPKYVKADFQGVAWEHRGKLDVPKERFISYPGAERETDRSLVVGWAGWDHLTRARALATWYLQARRDGRDHEHLKPILTGLAELVPWLKQWYDDPNPDPALDRAGSQIAALVDAELRALQLTVDDLAGWQPVPTRRGRVRR